MKEAVRKGGDKSVDAGLDYAAIAVLVDLAPDLETFSHIEAWDKQAKVVVQDIDLVLEQIPEETKDVKSKLIASLEEYGKLSFLKRTFSKDRLSMELKNEIQTLHTLSSKLTQLKETLENLVDATPNDEDEAKIMIKELKLLKKDFTFEKTVVRGEVRDINQSARAQNSAISNQAIFSNAKIRRFQKMSVREQKENSLKPREQQIRALDVQIIHIEKKIHRIERIVVTSAKEGDF